MRLLVFNLLIVIFFIYNLQHLRGLLKNSGPLGLHPQKPLREDAPPVDISNITLASPPNYKLGEQVATRLAYGTALAKVCI